MKTLNNLIRIQKAVLFSIIVAGCLFFTSPRLPEGHVPTPTPQSINMNDVLNSLDTTLQKSVISAQNEEKIVKTLWLVKTNKK